MRSLKIFLVGLVLPTFVALAWIQVWVVSPTNGQEPLPKEVVLKRSHTDTEVVIATIGDPQEKELVYITDLIIKLRGSGYEMDEEAELTPFSPHLEVIFIQGVDYAFVKSADKGIYTDIRKVTLEKVVDDVLSTVNFVGGTGTRCCKPEEKEIEFETEN